MNKLLEEENMDQIPEDLKRRAQWVGWRYGKERSGRREKVPVDLATLRNAKVSDPETWTSFGEAKESLQDSDSGIDGIGFVFTRDDPFVGIDLDKCRDPRTGEIEPWAAKIVVSLDSYSEISPSGRGVHIIVKARVPDEAGSVFDLDGNKIEVYSCSRFFTVTGVQINVE